MKLLVIEDDVKVAEALRKGLESASFRVELAHDGAHGLWIAKEGRFDLVVLDLMLPGRNGFQICAELRAGGDWTPILVLTAKDGELDETEALETGADDFLNKPFSMGVLIARIHAVLRRARERGAPLPVSAGDLRIDPRTRRAWRGDTEVALTARQFDVLEHLMRRAGEVVSKVDLLASVWDHDFDGDPNIVEVYIRRLRSAVDEPFGRRSIETIRGVGYRIVTTGG